MNIDIQKRTEGALAGALIGDALAMPVHWYYDQAARERDYGRVVDYLAPKNPHPGSILWRSSYTPLNLQGDILHDQSQYWGRKGVHYHQFLAPGENTLNLKLLRLAVRTMGESGTYRVDEYASRYIDFMLAPGSHRDTYVEECHRGFFENYARGAKPGRCAVEEKHIGGMAPVIPLFAIFRSQGMDHREALRRVSDHVAVTHAGRKIADGVKLLTRIADSIIAGSTVKESVAERISAQDVPYTGFPAETWLALPPKKVIGRLVSSACYLEDSLPAVLYLALKYAADAEHGLFENTMVGGDNAHRGAVLGALVGLEKGVDAFPSRWVNGLKEPEPSWTRQP